MTDANLYATLIGKDFLNVGPATATKLMQAFTSKELLLHLENRDSDSLRAIPGVGENAILGLYRGYMVLKKKILLARYLDNMGLTKAVVNKVYELWGGQAIEQIKRNPYQLQFILSWEIIDPIGLSLGDQFHPCRLIGAVENCMYEDYEQLKNTCTPLASLMVAVKMLLDCDDAIAEVAIRYALMAGAVIQYNNVIQLPAAYSFERQIENMLSNNRVYEISEDKVRQYLRSGRYHNLTTEQENVVINAMQNRYSAYSGRSGRGKTYTVSAICDAAADLLKKDGHPIQPVLSAVAAKACQRMRKETGRDTSTIAYILYKMDRRDLEGKIVIVDEASMLSLSDAFHLIKKIPDSSRLVFLGDHCQIPSVDAGRVFYDIISTRAIPCCELTINQRQDRKTDEQLDIVLSGKFPEFEEYRPGVKTGLYRRIVENVYAAEEEAKKLYALFDGKAQIISPLKKFPGGSNSINNLIHQKYYGRQDFCKGSPVIFTHNSNLAIKSGGRPVSLTNGSMGTVTEVLCQNPKSSSPYLKVIFDVEGEVILTWSEVMDFLELAYCLTCHKSQGSDWETVIIVLPKSELLVDRNMIYTALSRCIVKSILIYYDHDYVVNRVKASPAHERRWSALFSEKRGSNVSDHYN